MLYHVLVVFGSAAVFAVPGLCCRPEEYTTADGQCCPMCQEGTVVRKDCTLESSTGCAPCGTGSYMNKPNGLPTCFTCSSCNAGLFTQKECTRTTNTVCGISDGYFCKSYSDDSGCSFAEKHSHCVSGQRIKALGTKTTDTECEDCHPGFYSLYGVNCTAWKICPEVKTEEGSPHKDVVCGNAASRHHYSLILPVLISLVIIFGLFIKGVVDWSSGRRVTTEKLPVEEVGHQEDSAVQPLPINEF
ncbi:tumor necrosis factor receptor superfamily member 14-like isoform X2 [Centroberyx affinis]|uniref:tumor necrosis factor receptor superfamily member 14-like isoform X2 n=1 Tax=Centroberyx affinis TaxID=166261 RepID=UPI003A5BE982